MKNVAVAFIALTGSFAFAISPTVFESRIDFPFTEGSVALPLSERVRLDEHLRAMEAKGECSVQWVAVIGADYPKRTNRASLVPRTQRGAYMKETLNRRGFERPIFWPDGDPPGGPLAPGAVRVYFSGNHRARPCTFNMPPAPIDWSGWPRLRSGSTPSPTGQSNSSAEEGMKQRPAAWRIS